MKNLEDFNKTISDCFAIEFESENETHYRFKIKGTLDGKFKELISSVNKSDFDQMLMDEKTFIKNVNSIEKNGYFECLVKNDRKSHLVRDIEKKLTGDNVSFEIGIPSIQLLTNVLFDLSQGVGYSARNSFFKNSIKNGEYFKIEKNHYDTFEQIRNLSNDLRSVSVKCPDFDIEKLKKMAKSFLYEINYSCSEAFTTVEVSVYDLFRSNQHYGPIRKQYHEINHPIKIYDEEILSYYQRAISTNNIEFQFLSFYQILEYFYDKYFSDSMSANLLKRHNENPFDLNDNTSRFEIIETVILKYRRLNEKDSLKDILKSIITSKEEFKRQVSEIDETILEYLKNPWSGFLDFDSFDYDVLSIDQIIAHLSNRIYSIRNEVTHRKSKKTKYIPQKHERFLLYETRLLQIIVELIIDKNGKAMW